MSRIDELVRRLSPNGVKVSRIGDVAQCTAGATPASGVAAYWENGTIPWMSSGEVNKGIVENTDKKITQAGYESCSTKMLPPNIVVVALAGQGKTRGLVARTRIALCTNQSLAAIVPGDSVDSDYLYYYLQTQYQRLRSASAGDGGRGGLNLQTIRGYRIPVPPVDVQREIVRVLDSFWALEAELEAELEARRLQYTYYRDLLMSFGDGVRRLPMAEVATIVRGASPRPIRAFLTDDQDGVPWIKIGDVPAGGKYITGTAERVTKAGAAKSRMVHPGDFVLSNSMSFGRPYISRIDGAIHDGWLAISNFSGSFLPDFLYHMLRSAPLQREFARRAGSSTVSNLNADIVRAVPVPVPSLQDQNRIVGILDNFEVLVNSLSDGLPAELRDRRAQYEYYRDRLLTFEEAMA